MKNVTDSRTVGTSINNDISVTNAESVIDDFNSNSPDMKTEPPTNLADDLHFLTRFH